MTVYVNKLRVRYGRMTLCHLLADDLGELHAMAQSLGLDRSWFQPGALPHYDISLAVRGRAIAAGAQVINRAELALLARRYAAAGS